MAGYIGSKAVNLSTTGADINGDANIDGNLSFRDNDKAIFGAGSDLQIYHDGSNSYIDEAGTGTLRIRGYNQVRITDTSDNIAAIFKGDAESTLYHNNAAKLATASTGVSITGALDLSATTGSGTLNIISTVNASNAGNKIAFFGANRSDTDEEMAYIKPLLLSNSGGSGNVQEGHLAFGTSGNEAMRIDSSGNVGISSSSPTSLGTGMPTLELKGNSASQTDRAGGIRFERYDGTYAGAIFNADGAFKHDSGAYPMLFVTNSAERMRIDTSGNLLVGKTSSDASVSGCELRPAGRGSFTATDDFPLQLRRYNSDGDIIQFRKEGTTVGSIGTLGGYTYISGPSSSGLYFGGSRVQPMNSGSLADNAIDMGHPSYRFDDIYATNGTINTSDRNEKQDIEVLSDAETRVAVAAKGLLRKFRWIDAVAEKGDEARTHFGIIAQDLQAAFAAEGLDAGDYAMFISSTWTDEETGEERTRMGVRYSELLAFIIGAL